MTLVKWENLCKPKEHGGLRTKDNTLSLKALFAKWKWRLGTCQQGLWREVLELKYGTWRKLNEEGRLITMNQGGGET